MCKFPLKGGSELSKCDGRLIRARAGAGVANLIRKRARGRATDAIGVKTIIPGGNYNGLVGLDALGNVAFSYQYAVGCGTAWNAIQIHWENLTLQ